jgi:hypothetical protein
MYLANALPPGVLGETEEKEREGAKNVERTHLSPATY